VSRGAYRAVRKLEEKKKKKKKKRSEEKHPVSVRPPGTITYCPLRVRDRRLRVYTRTGETKLPRADILLLLYVRILFIQRVSRVRATRTDDAHAYARRVSPFGNET